MPNQSVNQDREIGIHRTAGYGRFPGNVFQIDLLSIELSSQVQKSDKGWDPSDQSFFPDLFLR